MKYFSKEYFEKLWSIANQYILDNYDYCYLKAMHEKNRTIGAKTIIAGMSYARNGIVETYLEDAINFSSASQDLYFNFEHIKKAVEEGNQKIKTCIINFGYYAMYWDLSHAKNVSCIIKKAHYPVLGKAHHYSIDEDYDMMQNIKYDKSIFKGNWVREFVNEWADGFFREEPTYYGSLKTREDDNQLGVKKIPWNVLSADTKKGLASQIVSSQNRIKIHEHTRQENEQLLKEMVEYLYQNHITPIFLILPFTTYYNEYIDKEYKEGIISLLEELPYPVEFLDMNDYPDNFDDTDFLDAEHLNLRGALKATAFLIEYLSLIKSSK